MSGLDSLIGDSIVLTLCKVLLLLVILFNIKSAFKQNAKGGTGYFVLFVVMVIYCVFYCPDVGDNYSTMSNYYQYLNGTNSDDLHFESIYFRIMDLIPFGYVYYRLFVWGIACLLFIWLMKRMNIKSEIATLSVLTFALPYLLYYQRAAFSYVLLYFAAYCYVSKEGIFIFKKFYIIAFIILLLCAVPFHRSMPVYIAILLFSIFVPKNKLGLVLIVVLFVLFAVSAVSNSIVALQLLQGDALELGTYYIENGSAIQGQNLNGWIAYFLRLFPILCLMIYGLYRMIKTPNYLTEMEKICLINSLTLMVISMSFMAISFTIQIKFRNAAMMPWTVFLASFYTRKVGSRECFIYVLATIVVSVLLYNH